MPKPASQPSPDYATAKGRSRNPGYGSAIAEELCVKFGFAARTFFTAVAAVLNVAASAQNLDLAASGFAIAPKSGYVAAPGAPSSPSQVVVRLTKPAEPGTACEVSFEALPGFEDFSQDALNRQTDNPNWDLFYRDGLGEFYAVRR